VVQTGRLYNGGISRQIFPFGRLSTGCCQYEYIALTVCSRYVYDQAPRTEVLYEVQRQISMVCKISVFFSGCFTYGTKRAIASQFSSLVWAKVHLVRPLY